jgi:prepilin-type N-terminal cleavage/methylation domain-containing protein
MSHHHPPIRPMNRDTLPVRARGNRAGFTLVEVIVASLIMTATLLTMAGFTVRYQQIDTSARLVIRAQQAANERLERVRTAQPYLSLDTMATTESSPDGFTGFTRVTNVTHIGGSSADTVDFRVVTVTVTTPGIPKTIKKSSTVGAF